MELSVVGHVRLSGFRVADNVVNGIEITETMGEWGGPQVKVGMHVGRTAGQGTCGCGVDSRSRYVGWTTMPVCCFISRILSSFLTLPSMMVSLKLED